jgi:hypothetical protein
MSTDILTVRLDHTADPEGTRLQTLLATELAYERAHTTRQRWLGIAVCAGIVALIIRVLGIDADAGWSTTFATAAVAVLSLRTGIAVLVEQHRHRRWSQRCPAIPAPCWAARPEH